MNNFQLASQKKTRFTKWQHLPPLPLPRFHCSFRINKVTGTPFLEVYWLFVFDTFFVVFDLFDDLCHGTNY